jgi:hypothetical protein
MPPRLLLVDLVLGVALLATIGFAARSPLTAQSRGRRLIGWLLVAFPLPLVVAARLFAPSSPLGGEIAFALGVVCFAGGVLLVVTEGDDEEGSDGPHDLGPPPWWPDFEREFRTYASRQSRRRVSV